MLFRHEIYAKEAAGILRAITMYRVVIEGQLYRFYPGKEESIKKVLQRFVWQRRVAYDKATGRYAANDDCLRETDDSMIKALWVLVDFIDKVEFHSRCDFPAKIVFFAESQMYEVIHVPCDSEILIASALSLNSEDELKRIIIVDQPGQIEKLSIPHTAGYCLVDADGQVHYYRHQ